MSPHTPDQKTGMKGAQRKAPPVPEEESPRRRPEEAGRGGDERHRVRDEELDENV